MRTATVIGVAPPAQTNTRPSGRYRLIAPEAPVGSVLRVTTREANGCRSTRFVHVVDPHGLRLFVDLDGNEVAFTDWEFATRSEAQAFHLERQIATYADEVELHGAPRFFTQYVEALPHAERDNLLGTVADELRVRGKDGKASQLLAFRWEGA